MIESFIIAAAFIVFFLITYKCIVSKTVSILNKEIDSISSELNILRKTKDTLEKELCNHKKELESVTKKVDDCLSDAQVRCNEIQSSVELQVSQMIERKSISFIEAVNHSAAEILHRARSDAVNAAASVLRGFLSDNFKNVLSDKNNGKSDSSDSGELVLNLLNRLSNDKLN